MAGPIDDDLVRWLFKLKAPSGCVAPPQSALIEARLRVADFLRARSQNAQPISTEGLIVGVASRFHLPEGDVASAVYQLAAERLLEVKPPTDWTPRFNLFGCVISPEVLPDGTRRQLNTVELPFDKGNIAPTEALWTWRRVSDLPSEQTVPSAEPAGGYDFILDYAHHFPLVGERDAVKARKIAKGQIRDFQQAGLVEQGFPPDSWLPIELIRKWRTPVFPKVASREAIQQWQLYLRECLGLATTAAGRKDKSSWDTTVRELAEGMAHDLELLRRHVPELFDSDDPACSPKTSDLGAERADGSPNEKVIMAPQERTLSDLRFLAVASASKSRLDGTLFVQFKEYPTIYKAAIALGLWKPAETPTPEAVDAIADMLRKNLNLHQQHVYELPLSQVARFLQEHIQQQRQSSGPEAEQVAGRTAARTNDPQAATKPPMPPVELFFSYSHKDEKLREQLEQHLIMLQRQGIISAWHDRKIGAGTEWEGQIDEHLNKARVILLLVSVHFLNSGYCYDKEMERAMTRHDAGEARVIPIIIGHCDWQHPPLSKLLAVPKDGRPVTDFRPRDKAFKQVTQRIRAAIAELTANR